MISCITPQIIRLFSVFSALLILTMSAHGGQAFIRGRSAVAEADYQRGIELLRIAVDEESSNPEVWRLLGFSYRMLDSLDAAVSAYEQVLILQPDDYDAKLALGMLFALSGENEASNTIYGEILATDSTDVEAWLGIGRSYSWQNALPEAEEAYRKALYYKSDYPRSMLGLAEVLAWQDKPSEAREVYGQLLAIDSTYSEAWIGLGKTWYWVDRPYRALEHLGKAKSLDENNPQVNDLISQITRQVSWHLKPDYSYWVEDDDGLSTESEKISFSVGKRVNDTFEVGGNVAAFSSFRDGLWRYRRQLGLHSVMQTVPGLTIQSDAQMDVLSGEMDLLRLQGNIRGRGQWSWIESSLRYENVLYELWSNTRASGGWGELAFSWTDLFKISAGAGRWDMTDENTKIQASVNLDISVLEKNGFSFFLNSRYLDFEENVTGYWTPQKLRYDGAGILIETNINRSILLSGYGEYAVNTYQDRFIRLYGSVQVDLAESINISSGITYFETDTNYRMLLWNLSLVTGGMF